jgi:hypothetical protein
MHISKFSWGIGLILSSFLAFCIHPSSSHLFRRSFSPLSSDKGAEAEAEERRSRRRRNISVFFL